MNTISDGARKGHRGLSKLLNQSAIEFKVFEMEKRYFNWLSPSRQSRGSTFRWQNSLFERPLI